MSRFVNVRICISHSGFSISSRPPLLFFCVLEQTNQIYTQEMDVFHKIQGRYVADKKMQHL